MKVRASSIPIELSGKETLVPLLHKFKSPEVALLTDYQARQLEAFAKMRNDAAHGGTFGYCEEEVRQALDEIANAVRRLLGER